MQLLRTIAALVLIASVAACSTVGGFYSSGGSSGAPSGRYPDNDELPKGSQGVARKIGKPYKVAGRWYYPKEDETYDEIGLASWYGKDFHGKKTANGEYFNMNALTAAHKTLPLPSFVKVTNLSNGRSIVLRVNDRGPFVNDRLLDVSRRGAQLLGFHKQGVTRVRIQVVDHDGNLPRGARKRAPVRTAQAAEVNSKAIAAKATTHFIQVGAYSQRTNAEIQVKKLRRSGHRARVEAANAGGRTYWRVRIGPFIKRLIAEARLDRIVSDGFYEARIFTEAVQ
jgi:peptidoglycan lytic transglycosylase